MRPRCAVVMFAVACAGCGGDGAPTARPTAVVANYAGTWTGSWTKQQCHDMSSPGITMIGCLGISAGQLRVTLTQSASSVLGSVAVEGFLTPVSGTIGSDGALSLNGRVEQQGRSLTVSIWRSSITAGVMSGAFTYSIDPDPANASAGTWQGSFSALRR